MAAFRQPEGIDSPPAPTGRAPAGPLPGQHGRVEYDPRLIDSLLHDHAELRHLFGRIGGAARSGGAKEIQALLLDFKSRLEAHVLTESLRFYDVVEQAVLDQPDVATMVHAFRHEMNDIERTAIDFVKKYRACRFTPEQRSEFAMDYAVVERQLDHRLATEEDSLYRLYRPR